MDFAELRAFIANGMRMQHIYQPVMVKTLLESKKNRVVVYTIQLTSMGGRGQL